MPIVSNDRCLLPAYFTGLQNNNNNNETPTVRGLATNNNNMQSVLMGNMETI